MRANPGHPIWKDEQARYRRFFNDAALGIFQTSADGILVAANPALARMFGFESPQEVLGLKAADYYLDPADRDAIVNQTVASRETTRGEGKFRRRDGSLFDGVLHLWAVRDRDGTVVGLEGFGGDLEGKICHQVFRGQDKPCPHCTNPKLLDQDGDPAEVCQWEGQNPITGKYYMNYDRALRWIDGRLVRLQVAIDITEAKEEKRRQRLERQLQQAQKLEAVGTLAGGIAPDFNNLLQAIQGYAELLLLDLKPADRGHRELNEIFRAAKRGSDLVRQLLAFSRSQALKPVPLDLNGEVTKVAAILEHTIPKMVTIKLDLAPELPAIEADPVQIEQLLLNLAVNSRDAMPDGGDPTSKTRVMDDCGSNASRAHGVLLEVGDTGCGAEGTGAEGGINP